MANTRFKTHHGLNATANSYIDGKLEVTGDLVVSGNVAFSGSSTGDFRPDADQRNLGNTSLRWNLIGFAANLASTLTANGATTLSNTLLTTGAATFQNTVTVTGVTNVSSNVNVGGVTSISNNLIVSGTGTVNGALTANGNTSFTNGLLTVNTNNGTLANTLTVGPANVSIDSGTLFVDAINNRVGINNTAPGVALRVTGAVDISSTANVQGNANVGGTLGVAGITTLAANAVLGGVLQTIAGNSNFDSGVLFVDSVNNRVGVNNTAPGVAFEVTGAANVSTSVNSALLTVGTNFIANTIGAYHTGTVNASSFTTTGVLINTTAVVPTSNTILLGNTIGRWVITANSIAANSLAITGVSSSGNTTITGWANVSAGVNSAQFTVGAIGVGVDGFIANSTHISVGDTVNNVQITATGMTISVADGLKPSSNILGHTLGSTLQRWDLTASNGNFSHDVTIGGNLTVTGTTTYINTTNLNVGDNIVTLNADLGAVAPTENAGLEINRGSSANVLFLWNETSDTWTLGNTVVTGFANVSVSVNSALLTVGTSFIANTFGVYHTGVVNAASHTVGSNFIANTTAVVSTGYANISTSVNSAALTVGTIVVANTSGIAVGNSTHKVVIGTTGSLRTYGSTGGLVPESNTVGNALGEPLLRWNLSATDVDSSGEIAVGTRLYVNSSYGTAGQVLLSGGSTNTYWGSASVFNNDLTINQTSPAITLNDTDNVTSTTNSMFMEFNAGNFRLYQTDDGTGSNARFTFVMTTGNLTIDGELAAASDERKKDNIVTVDGALGLVDSMRGVYFTRKGSDEKHVGVIAQEMQRVLPEVVSEDNDGYLAVSYGNIVGVLIEAIKELKREIQELKNGNQS